MTATGSTRAPRSSSTRTGGWSSCAGRRGGTGAGASPSRRAWVATRRRSLGERRRERRRAAARHAAHTPSTRRPRAAPRPSPVGALAPPALRAALHVAPVLPADLVERVADLTERRDANG